MTSISTITGSLNDLLENQNAKVHVNYKTIGSNLIDATALIGHVSKEPCFKCKDQILFCTMIANRPALEAMKLIMSFGSDLAGKVQQLK